MIHRLFRSSQIVPREYRSNFLKLYADIGWWGVLNGTTISFLAIYAARLGANSEQIGLINATPALVTLLFSLPAGIWITQQSIKNAIVRTAIIQRVYYLFFILLPFYLSAQQQIPVIIIFVLLMNIPGAVLVVGFNAYYAQIVPEEWRAYVTGIRNAILAFTTIVISIVSGLILNHFPFPIGYQIVFAMGFIGGVISTYYLWRIEVSDANHKPTERLSAANDASQPGNVIKVYAERYTRNLHLEVWKGPFKKVLFAMFGLHLAQYLPIPIFPIYSVQALKLNDQVISLGTAIFYGAVFIGSTQLSKVTSRIGNRKTTAVGLFLLGGFPLILSLANGPFLYLVANLFGGIAWSLVGGAMYNYVLENTPPDQRPTYLAWFTLAANAAILIGSLSGPLIGNVIGLIAALVLFGILRIIMGLAILRYG